MNCSGSSLAVRSDAAVTTPLAPHGAAAAAAAVSGSGGFSLPEEQLRGRGGRYCFSSLGRACSACHAAVWGGRRTKGKRGEGVETVIVIIRVWAGMSQRKVGANQIKWCLRARCLSPARKGVREIQHCSLSEPSLHCTAPAAASAAQARHVQPASRVPTRQATQVATCFVAASLRHFPAPHRHGRRCYGVAARSCFGMHGSKHRLSSASQQGASKAGAQGETQEALLWS